MTSEQLEPARGGRSKKWGSRRVRLAWDLLRGRDEGLSGRAIVVGCAVLGAASGLLSNLIGAGAVLTLLVVVLPRPEAADSAAVILRNVTVAAGFVGAVVVWELFRGGQMVVRRLRWLWDEREPTDQERRATIRLRRDLTMREFAWWIVATVVFTILNAGVSPLLAVEVGLTIAIGGLVTAAASYLLTEWVSRPLVARALRGYEGPTPWSPGLATRTVLTWAVGTGMPVAGLVLLAALAPIGDPTVGELARAIAILGGIALLAGLTTMLVYARIIAAPLRAVREALVELRQGRTDVSVRVDDATEIGELQVGVNQLARGLAERDRLRDLFGLHVGPEVAARALEEGVTLGGEERDVAVLFIDVVGSTALAERGVPTDVVARLNDFFSVVVSVTHAHGGIVNKFEGDAALCIWGAPLRHADPAGGALAAAREMATGIAAGEGGLSAAVAVAYGRVVAGNVGAAARLEYTVIGDPVNTAARLTDVAKRRGLQAIATADAVEACADPDEAAWWEPCGVEQLRGRSQDTALMRPRT